MREHLIHGVQHQYMYHVNVHAVLFYFGIWHFLSWFSTIVVSAEPKYFNIRSLAVNTQFSIRVLRYFGRKINI